jgi:hypothetical protein
MGTTSNASSTTSLNGSSKHPMVPLPHAPIHEKLNHGSLQAFTREIWGPSFDFAKFSIELLIKRFEWALRDKTLVKKIQPYGFNATLSTVT